MGTKFKSGDIVTIDTDETLRQVEREEKGRVFVLWMDINGHLYRENYNKNRVKFASSILIKKLNEK